MNSLAPSEPGPIDGASASQRVILMHKWKLVFASFVIAFAAGLWANHVQSLTSERWRVHGIRQQQARTLGQILFNYAEDKGGKWPEGKSSTEIFQKMLDEGYATDPNVFYFPMEGKTKPTSSMLKPENVCWDVTGGITKDDSDDLPVVFMTGYKMDYRPNAIATPLKNTDPDGFAVYFMGNNAINFKIPLNGPTIQSTFDAKGKTYVQLTPDGPLP